VLNLVLDLVVGRCFRAKGSYVSQKFMRFMARSRCVDKSAFASDELKGSATIFSQHKPPLARLHFPRGFRQPWTSARPRLAPVAELFLNLAIESAVPQRLILVQRQPDVVDRLVI